MAYNVKWPHGSITYGTILYCANVFMFFSRDSCDVDATSLYPKGRAWIAGLDLLYPREGVYIRPDLGKEIGYADPLSYILCLCLYAYNARLTNPD